MSLDDSGHFLKKSFFHEKLSKNVDLFRSFGPPFKPSGHPLGLWLCMQVPFHVFLGISSQFFQLMAGC